MYLAIYYCMHFHRHYWSPENPKTCLSKNTGEQEGTGKGQKEKLEVMEYIKMLRMPRCFFFGFTVEACPDGHSYQLLRCSPHSHPAALLSYTNVFLRNGSGGIRPHNLKTRLQDDDILQSCEAPQNRACNIWFVKRKKIHINWKGYADDDVSRRLSRVDNWSVTQGYSVPILQNPQNDVKHQNNLQTVYYVTAVLPIRGK